MELTTPRMASPAPSGIEEHEGGRSTATQAVLGFRVGRRRRPLRSSSTGSAASTLPRPSAAPSVDKIRPLPPLPNPPRPARAWILRAPAHPRCRRWRPSGVIQPRPHWRVPPQAGRGCRGRRTAGLRGAGRDNVGRLVGSRRRQGRAHGARHRAGP